MNQASERVPFAATLLQRLLFGEESFQMPTLPPVAGGRWGGTDLAALWGPLDIDGAELVWELNAKHGTVTDLLDFQSPLDGLRNQSALLELVDGRQIKARFGARRSRIGRQKCSFHTWSVHGRTPTRWVGKVRGASFGTGNLGVRGPEHCSSSHLRLEGRYTWYVLDRRPDENAINVVVEAAQPSELDWNAVGSDFMALQFALGVPLQLETLVALDEPGNVIGCAGAALGSRPARRRPLDGPVPYSRQGECWVAVLFHRLAAAMATSELPYALACHAYLDSVAEATIDGAYLKLQIALEEFARSLRKQEESAAGIARAPTRLLVRDKDTWIAWVDDHVAELRGMVAEGENPAVFVDKVRSAMNLPSSGVVADVLARLDPPLVVGRDVLNEVRQRNIPVHSGRMNKPGVDYVVDRDVERLDILRSLLVALVSRACGYDGAISGWLRSAPTWKPAPDWWPEPSVATTAEARRTFLYGQ